MKVITRNQSSVVRTPTDFVGTLRVIATKHLREAHREQKHLRVYRCKTMWTGNAEVLQSCAIASHVMKT